MKKCDAIGSCICRTCGIKQKKIMRSKYERWGSFVYVNEHGKIWKGKRCPECTRKQSTIDDRKAGRYGPRENITYYKAQKGLASEKLVANFFIKNGYSVSISSGMGSDLTLVKNGYKLTCEVKSVVKRNDGETYYIPKISKYSKNDDIIAFVFKNNFLHIEPMQEHLLHCTPSGQRTITEMAKIVHEQTC